MGDLPKKLKCIFSKYIQKDDIELLKKLGGKYDDIWMAWLVDVSARDDVLQFAAYCCMDVQLIEVIDWNRHIYPHDVERKLATKLWHLLRKRYRLQMVRTTRNGRIS